MARSYVSAAQLDIVSDLTEARIMVGLSVEDCIELCDTTERTWYRWQKHGAPRWAIRLILSQRGTLDRFGWKHWEIRRGTLYCNELHHRYYWEPANLLLPLYGITDAAAPFITCADNLSSIDEARKLKRAAKGAVNLDAQGELFNQNTPNSATHNYA